MQNIGNLISEQLRNPNELDISLRMEFGPFETVHRWKRLNECYEFVGARRSKHTAVAYKDAIYVFGGDNGKSMLNDLIRFDVKEMSWTSMGCQGTPPPPRYHHSAVVHRSSMFVFGGYTGDILANSNLTNKNDLFEYKFTSASWVQWRFTGPEPVPRSAHGAAVYDDKLWIFAGYDGNARLNDMWTLSLSGESQQWERVEQYGACPPTCCNFPVAVARGKMFVFSGQSGAKITNALYQFDFESLTWSRVCTEHLLRSWYPAPARRYGHVMVAHGSHLYVFGGAADNTLPADLHQFDLDTHTWSVIEPTSESQVPSGRLFHAGAVVRDSLYIFGGTVDNNVRSGELFLCRLPDYPRCTLREDFGRILKSAQFCDLVVLVGADQIPIPAHQAILAARSPYLRTKIVKARQEYSKRRASKADKGPESGFYNGAPALEIRLPEATPEAFRMLLDYIYTDYIDPTEKCRKSSKEKATSTPTSTNNYVPWNYEEEDEASVSPATMELVLEVLSLALRVEVPRLHGLCARFLRANLRPANVLHVLTAAHHADLACIKEHCLRFIVREWNFTTIVMSAAFEALEPALMVEVVRRRHGTGTGTVTGQPPPPPPPLPPPALAPALYDRDLAANEGDDEILGTTLEQDMAVFMNGGGDDLADVKLRIGNNLRPGHRSILAARASYFEAMFRSFSPPDNIVNIQICETIPPEGAFDSLLRYMYYGATEMHTEDSLYLFQAPIYYGFTNNRLQVFCKHVLQSNVCPDNVLAILAAADRMRATDIKDYALKIVVRNFHQISKQEGIKSLSQPLLVDVLQALADYLTAERLLPQAKAQPSQVPPPRSISASPSTSSDVIDADEPRHSRSVK